MELHGVTLHEYPSTKPGYRYCLPSEEYRRQARGYFPHSYQHVDEELDALYWGQQHHDIGILDIRYGSVLVGTKRRYLLGATAGEAEGSPSSFPVVVGERVYQQLAEALGTYGAVRVEKIAGKISIGDERFRPPFRREFYRDPLFLEVDESGKIDLMDKPHQVLGDAWTVAELDGTPQILAFTFALGTIEWEERLKEQCWRVEKVCKKHGGYPLVDFDAQRRRFTTATLNPEAIDGWYDQIIERLILRPDPSRQTITRAITRNESPNPLRYGSDSVQASHTVAKSEMDDTGVTQLTSILFLAADPADTSRLRLGEEFREIHEKLKLARLSDRFKLELPQLSIRPADISQALLDTEPQIVHFSGHGESTGALCFENELGQTHLVPPDALAALFEQFAKQVNCVLLNACYSETQANAIGEHIKYVIGMNQAISDKAAIAFVIGFYQALGAGRTIEDAYKLGCVQIGLQGIREHLTPVLIKK